jgi:hypothetical protein
MCGVYVRAPAPREAGSHGRRVRALDARRGERAGASAQGHAPGLLALDHK